MIGFMEKGDIMEIKLNDVYKFRYNNNVSKSMFDPYHCFDGQLVVRKNYDGGLCLEDTYWSYIGNVEWQGDSSNRRFTLESALEQGTLTFICNMDDVEKCSQGDLDYYANEDLFDLSYQHDCYPRYFKRKRAEKSSIKMQKVLEEKIAKTKREIECNQSELKRAEEKLAKLQSGDMNIYI
jgi:hypothetical protein